MRTQADYMRLHNQLREIERKQGPNCYLTDMAVDSENAAMPETVDGYWPAMTESMVSAAFERANEQSVDLRAYGFNEAY